jgi:hypothetical protein
MKGERLMRKRSGAVVVLAALLLVGGCQKLNFEQTLTLKPTEVKPYLFDAPAYEQKVTVTVTPTATGVSAYLCRESDHEKVALQLEAEKEPQAALLLGSRVSKGAAETYSFDATVPAKTPYALLLKGGGKVTEVKVKLVGR